MPDGILLLLACAPGLGPGKFPKLLHSLLVPATQCLHREGDEADAFPLTSLKVVPALVVEGYHQGMAETSDDVFESVKLFGRSTKFTLGERFDTTGP